MKKFAEYFRATRRAIAAVVLLPFMGMLAAAQGLVVGPVFRNYTLVPKILFGIVRRLLGLTVEFNAASAPLAKNKRTWFMINHITAADAAVVGGKLPGTFVGKAEVTKLPLAGLLFVRALKFVPVQRHAEYNAQARGGIAKNINAGHNIIMFPEATTNQSKEVFMFHGGLLKLLYGEEAVDKKGNDVALKQDVVVQPVAIRVKSVNGHALGENDPQRAKYAIPGDVNALRRIWARMKVKNITVELTAMPALDSKNFKDAFALANQAAKDVASVVNPGQTEFRKAPIPHGRI